MRASRASLLTHHSCGVSSLNQKSSTCRAVTIVSMRPSDRAATVAPSLDLMLQRNATATRRGLTPALATGPQREGQWR